MKAESSESKEEKHSILVSGFFVCLFFPPIAVLQRSWLKKDNSFPLQ